MNHDHHHHPAAATMKELYLYILFVLLGTSCFAQMMEKDRINAYRERSYGWPPKLDEYVPSTHGWAELQARRFEQISHIPDTSDRYSAYVTNIYNAMFVKNFTELGWGLVRAPEHIFAELQGNLQDALRNVDGDVNSLPNEIDIRGVEGEHKSKFVSQEDVNWKILNELLPLHEEWAGVKLTPQNAYGLRLYQNNTNMLMHIDNHSTHVISGILHVGRDPDSAPWPLVIEDFEGNTNEVYLAPGDLLFYESSKCVHGRPKKFNGSWYTSLFLHYYPSLDWDLKTELSDEVHYRVPPSWNEQNTTKLEVEELVVRSGGVTMFEPACEDKWCGLNDSVKRYRSSAPAEDSLNEEL